MSVSKLQKDNKGNFLCPVCQGTLEFADGGQVQVVDGHVDYENVKPRYICHKCHSFYRELLNTGFYDVFDLPKEEQKPAKASPVVPLEKNSQGERSCPVCNHNLEFSDGGQVRVVDGHVDYENVKPRYICRECKTFYRELLSSGLYEVFDLPKEDQKAARVEPKPVKEEQKATKAAKDAKTTKANPVVPLPKNLQGERACPACNHNLEFSDGGQVRVVDGHVDYENVKPRFICRECKTFYRELLSSGLYEVFDLPKDEWQPQKKKVIKKTSELEPMKLKCDAQGKCSCPRCGEDMTYVEPGAVKVVNGKVDMSDTVAHFQCDACQSVYRRIASTDYYQWSAQ